MSREIESAVDSLEDDVIHEASEESLRESDLSDLERNNSEASQQSQPKMKKKNSLEKRATQKLEDLQEGPWVVRRARKVLQLKRDFITKYVRAGDRALLENCQKI